MQERVAHGVGTPTEKFVVGLIDDAAKALTPSAEEEDVDAPETDGVITRVVSVPAHP